MAGDTGERELKLRVTSEGVEQAAADQERLAKAQREVTKAGEEQAQADVGAEATREGVSAEKEFAAAQTEVVASARAKAQALADVNSLLAEANALQQIGETQAAGVLRQQADQIVASNGLGEAQKKLGASTSDLAQVLSLVDPRLSMVTTGAEAASRVMGQFGQVNLFSADTFRKVTGAVKDNAASLLTLTAGGAALLGVYAVVQAFAKYREEVEKTNQALREQEEILNRLKGEKFEMREALAKEMIGRGKTSPEMLDQAQQDAEWLVKKGVEQSAAVQIAAAGVGEGVTRERMLAAGGLAMAGGFDVTGVGAAERMARLREKQLEEGQRNAAFIKGLEQDRLEGAKKEWAAVSAIPGLFGGGDVQFGEGTEDLLHVIEKRLGVSGERAREQLTLAAERAEGGFGIKTTIPPADWEIRTKLPYEEVFGRSPEEAMADTIANMFAPAHAKQARVQPAQTTINVYNPKSYRDPQGLRGGRNGANARRRSGRD